MFTTACSNHKENQVFGDKVVQEMEKMQGTSSGNYFYLALGDSYTIGERVEETARFPVQLVKKLNDTGIKTNSATLVARTGWTTEDLSMGIKNEKLKESYDLVTLLIGVNNQYRGCPADEYRVQFRELLQTAINFAGKNSKNVIVLSIPDYGVTPFAKYSNPEKIASEIDNFNQINLEETLSTGANYVDITPISRNAKNDDSLIAPDGLHPSSEMYRLWVELIFPVAEHIFGKK